MKTIPVREVGEVLRTLPANRDIDLGAEHEFHVFYPSGNELRFTGKMYMLSVLPPSLSPAIQTETEVFFLDPRGVIIVFQPTPIMVYAPTAPGARVQPEFLDWLAEHPEWPGVLFLRKGWAIDATKDGA